MIWPAGVGKTAIAEGLAYAIVHNSSLDGSPLPAFLRRKRVLQLDVRGPGFVLGLAPASACRPSCILGHRHDPCERARSHARARARSHTHTRAHTHTHTHTRTPHTRTHQVGLLIAGAKERGELENRVTRLVQECKDAHDVVLM